MSTFSCSINSDWVKTDAIGSAMNKSIAKAEGNMNQRKVLCFMASPGRATW